MRLVVLYRACNNLRDDSLERQAIDDAGLVYLTSRIKIQAGDLVIGRYSCVPFYKELAEDIQATGAELINSWRQHSYIADLQNWVFDLGELTPMTWSRLEDLPEEGPFVLKGGVNSRKGQWNTHMFARNKREAIEVHGKLSDDGLIGQQPIYIRQYLPLVSYGTSVGGCPLSKEFRFFVCDGEILTGGFYWSNQVENPPSPEEVPKDFLKKAIEILSSKVRFFVLDVAQTQSGDWIVIEVNDGQQSGLSENSPKVLYTELQRVLSKI